MRGIKVVVLRPEERGVDTHGNPVYKTTEEVVDNVLVNKPTTEDLLDSGSIANGYVLTFSLAFPKTWNKPLRGCRLLIPYVDPSREFYVIGDPRPIPHSCPTQWNYKVLVGVANG